MKKLFVLLMIACMIMPCAFASAESQNVCVCRIDEIPQLQFSVGTNWERADINKYQNTFLGFEPLLEFQNEDKNRTLSLYFIPYNMDFTPPASLEMVSEKIASKGIAARVSKLNGFPVLEGVTASTYFVLIQDTLQFGFFSVTTYPFTGQGFADLDKDIGEIYRTLQIYENESSVIPDAPSFTVYFDFNQQSADDELNNPAEQPDQPSETEAVPAPDTSCKNCGYTFPEDSDFKFCPNCGAPR